MFRHLSLCVLLALSCTLVAASSGTQPISTDPCGDPTREQEVGIAPWTDLCALSITTAQVAASDDSTVTEMTVRLDVLDTARRTPSLFRLGWATEECSIRILLGDETPQQAAISAIGAECGDEELPYDDCLLVVPLPSGPTPSICQQGMPTVAIDPPVTGDGAYTWTIRFEGAVADLAGIHAPGTVLTVASATAGSRTFDKNQSSARVACVADGNGFESCVGVTGDVMRTTSVLTVD